MRGKDMLKALGVGALALVLDFAIATGAVFAYSIFIEPGHDTAYYQAAAPGIATVSTRIAGPILLGLFVFLFSRKRPDRNPFLFALAVFAFYAILDGAMVMFQGFFTSTVMLTMALKLGGALAGAALAKFTGAAPRASADGPR